jgi:hypothetical protein
LLTQDNKRNPVYWLTVSELNDRFENTNPFYSKLVTAAAVAAADAVLISTHNMDPSPSLPGAEVGRTTTAPTVPPKCTSSWLQVLLWFLLLMLQ